MVSTKPKNNHAYFQCTSKTEGRKCKATASVQGPLEEGKFKILWHRIEKHDHEPNRISTLNKQFNALFKDACLVKSDVPVPAIFESVKMGFLSSLSSFEQSLFRERLNATAKSKLMIGYRMKGYKGSAPTCPGDKGSESLLPNHNSS